MSAFAAAAGFAAPRAARAPNSPPPPDRTPAEVLRFYRRRGFRKLWITKGRLSRGGESALMRLEAVAGHGLDPETYGAAQIRRRLNTLGRGEGAAWSVELALTQALIRWAQDLRQPGGGTDIARAFEHGLLPTPLATSAVLEWLSQGPTPAAGLARLERVNPVYDALQAAQATEPRSDRRRMLGVNLARARALPERLPPDHLLVDIPAQTLEVWVGGVLAETLPVAVGRQDMPTPALTGRLRFLVLNPYWHVPPDVAAETLAPIAARAGPGALLARGFEVRTGFDAHAEGRSPDAVDWDAVVHGRQVVYLRQKPGPENAMGAVKFIFPNSLGVYLHDTPQRSVFDQDRRLASAGCVRLSDADALARRLTGSSLRALDRGVPEQRVELNRAIPIYLLYLTARPTSRGIVRRPDIYGWDETRLRA